MCTRSVAPTESPREVLAEMHMLVGAVRTLDVGSRGRRRHGTRRRAPLKLASTTVAVLPLLVAVRSYAQSQVLAEYMQFVLVQWVSVHHVKTEKIGHIYVYRAQLVSVRNLD